jgi:hypothetical protein
LEQSDHLCGWHDRVGLFLSVDEHFWGTQLCTHHLASSLEPAGDPQKRAWHNCFRVLREQLAQLVQCRSEAVEWHIIFEYELPRERGRRPDVVLLAGKIVLVLEFKDHRTAQRAHIDQVAAYARDLRHYHAASHAATVVPVLVLTGSIDPPTTVDDVTIVGARDLADALRCTFPPQLGDSIEPCGEHRHAAQRSRATLRRGRRWAYRIGG